MERTNKIEVEKKAESEIDQLEKHIEETKDESGNLRKRIDDLCKDLEYCAKDSVELTSTKKEPENRIQKLDNYISDLAIDLNYFNGKIHYFEDLFSDRTSVKTPTGERESKY